MRVKTSGSKETASGAIDVPGVKLMPRDALPPETITNIRKPGFTWVVFPSLEKLMDALLSDDMHGKRQAMDAISDANVLRFIIKNARVDLKWVAVARLMMLDEDVNRAELIRLGNSPDRILDMNQFENELEKMLVDARRAGNVRAAMSSDSGAHGLPGDRK